MPAARGEIARTHARTGERVVVEALAIAAGIASNDARPWVLVGVVRAGWARCVLGFSKGGEGGKKIY